MHIASGAEVTVSAIPVQRKDAGHLGILKVDEQGRIIDFFEKPKDEKVIDSLSWPHLLLTGVALALRVVPFLPQWVFIYLILMC